jgi:hypothetical protein
MKPIKDTEAYRDKIATVDDTGKRLWIYPKKPKGRFYNARTIVSIALLAFLFITPFIKVNGEPFLLFNILERKFILFGILFTPQDFHLFVSSHADPNRIHHPFHGRLRPLILRLDMSSNHFHGNGLSQNRVLDRRRCQCSKKS